MSETYQNHQASSWGSPAAVLASPTVVAYRDLSRAAPNPTHSIGNSGERLAEEQGQKLDLSNSAAMIAQLSRKVLSLEAQVAGLNARVDVLQRSADSANQLSNSAAALRQKLTQVSPQPTEPQNPAADHLLQGRFAGFSFQGSQQPEEVQQSRPQLQHPATTEAVPAWVVDLQATCAQQHTRIRELELQLALRNRSPASSAPPPSTTPARSDVTVFSGGKVHTPHTDRVASSAARLAAASRGRDSGDSHASRSAHGPPSTAGSASLHQRQHQHSSHAAPVPTRGYGDAQPWPAHNLFASSAVTPLQDAVGTQPVDTRQFLSSSQRFQGSNIRSA